MHSHLLAVSLPNASGLAEHPCHWGDEGGRTRVSPCPEGKRTPSLTGWRQPTGPRNPPAWPLLQKAPREREAGTAQPDGLRSRQASTGARRAPRAPPRHVPNSSSPSSRSSSSSGSRAISQRSSAASPRGFSSSSPPEDGGLGKSPSSFWGKQTEMRRRAPVTCNC